MKVRAPRGIALENSLDNDAVKVHVGIEQGARAVDEGDCADPGRWVRTRAALAHALLHRTQEDVHGEVLDGRIAYNTRPRAAEVLVDGGQAHLIRSRESVAELYALERIVPL